MHRHTNNNILCKEIGQSRSGGILLHITSLPGPFGIGDLGKEAKRFIDFLKSIDIKIWQILPLGPTGYGNSPYSSTSAFAGNPLLINLEDLCEKCLLNPSDLKTTIKFSKNKVDYERVINFKWPLLRKAFDNFIANNTPILKKEFTSFCESNKYWLNDFALFMSIKMKKKLTAWETWEKPLRMKEKQAINDWYSKNEKEILFQKFVQYLFFTQWFSIKSYANNHGIKIIGDIPLFVAYDSAEVWSNPELFYLDDNKRLVYVAGVPPDYFSETGQRWGNPLYRWDVLKKNGYQWWIERIRHSFILVDILRIDHFRGFESYWQIPANEPTAKVGRWVKGPGKDFFQTLNNKFGKLPIIAEDLGFITPEVETLLKFTGYPGMRILQFAFGSMEDRGTENRFLPHNYNYNTIVYTGTHDNTTIVDWFENANDKVKKHFLSYCNSDGKDIVFDMIRLAWSSVACVSIVPLQDLLKLDKKGRMNLPGTTENNWIWRFKWNDELFENGKLLKYLNNLYER